MLLRGLLLFSTLITSHRVAGFANPEACVYDKIFSNYNKNIRPVRHPDDKVELDMKFVFRNLGGINEREEVFEIVGYIWMEWYDFQLEWDPEECNGTRQIKMPADNLWLPEVILSNSNKDFHQYTFKRDFGSWARYDGRAHWAHGGEFNTVCDLNLKEYPFDEHNCSIVLESWLYNVSELEINVKPTGFDLVNQQRDDQWTLKDMDAMYFEVSPGWPGLRASFLWKRKIEFHVFNIVCPTAFILVVALGVFWLPADCGEKVSLSITVLLAFSVIQLVIMDIMPPSSENIPNISLLVVGVMSLSTISVITSMVVVYISFKPECTPVPKLLRKVLYSRLSWLVGLKAELPLSGYQELDSDTASISPDQPTGAIRYMKDNMHVYDVISHLTQVEAKQKEATPRRSESMESFKRRRRLDEAKLSTLQEILTNLKTLVKMKNDDSKDQSVVMEWKTLAKLVDRIIFFTCLLVLVVWLFTFI